MSPAAAFIARGYATAAAVILAARLDEAREPAEREALRLAADEAEAAADSLKPGP